MNVFHVGFAFVAENDKARAFGIAAPTVLQDEVRRPVAIDVANYR